MEHLRCVVERITYQNADNGYTVLKCAVKNYSDLVTVVGTMPDTHVGSVLSLEGMWKMDAKYGRQFLVEKFEETLPATVYGIEKYLGSGLVKGVGPKFAKRIVEKFGKDTLDVIEETPDELLKVSGIGKVRVDRIKTSWQEQKEIKNIMLFLQSHEVSTSHATKIFKTYGSESIAIVKENPYRLADDIWGIGFKTADSIAQKMGIDKGKFVRLRSGIFYTLLQSVSEGHVYLLQEVLLYRASQLLDVEVQHIEKYVMDLAMEKKVVLKESDEGLRVYSSHYYYMELTVAKMLHDLNVDFDVTPSVLEHRIHMIEEEAELALDDRQREAVMEAVRHGILIVTGGPGTGKTTTINAMIHFFEEEGADILLAAPTGRAAKRMTEATGCEAQTIHRLLEVSGNPEDDDKRDNVGFGNGFGRNAENPLESDVIIIDEMSMVDLPLMKALLDAIMPGTRLIMVGDGNQLPSVGPGRVLKDMIASDCFPVVKLEKIFRQAKESDIIVNAHKINRGEPVILDNKSMDFFFLKRSDPNVIISVVITLIQKKLPKFVDASPYDIQVLTPMRKGNLGVERLNKILQQYLNPPSPQKQEKEVGDRLLREGDKVMQIKNNYQLEWEVCTKYGMTIDKGLGVFNGDMGIIKNINTYEETVTVEYDEQRQVKYPYAILDELELAYAITIHKAQGSEYPAVVIPLLQGPRQLYNRNLIYTAVTRARKCVTLVGSDSVFQEMIQNISEQRRNTSLAERIRELA